MKLKIGDFSKMGGTTVKTLRHYEEVGLLIPQEVDAYTGYRYYAVEELDTLCRIRYCRRLGFSLEETKRVIHDDYDDAFIQGKREEFRAEKAAAEWKLAELSDFRKNLSGGLFMEEITIKSLPAVTVASYRTTVDTYGDIGNVMQNVFYPELKRLGAESTGYCFNLYHDGEHKENNIDVEFCEGVKVKKTDSETMKFKEFQAVPVAVCVLHRGDYGEVGRAYAKMMEYVEKNGFEIVSCPREHYIEGPWNTKNKADWLTEIQTPVIRKA